MKVKAVLDVIPDDATENTLTPEVVCTSKKRSGIVVEAILNTEVFDAFTTVMIPSWVVVPTAKNPDIVVEARVDCPATLSAPDDSRFVEEAEARVVCPVMPSVVPDADPNMNWVVAVMVPEALISKNLVLFVEETTESMAAVWAARPSKRTVVEATPPPWTVNVAVDVAPMPTGVVEVVRYTKGKFVVHPVCPPLPVVSPAVQSPEAATTFLFASRRRQREAVL